MADVRWDFKAENKASGATRQVQNDLKKITAQLRKMDGAGKKAGDGMRKAGKGAKQAKGSFDNLNASMGTLVKGFIGFQAVRVVGRQMSEAVKVTMEFNQAVQDAGVLAGATGQEFGLLEAKARQLGASTQFTARQSAEAMQEYARAGFTAVEITNAMDGSLALAAATGGTMEQASSAMVATIKAFGLEAGNTSELSDIFTNAINNSRFSIESLNEALKFGAPAGAAFNQSTQDSVAVMSKLVDLLGQGSMAGTAYRAALTSLGSPTDQAAGALHKYGLTIADVDPTTHSFSETLKTLADRNLTAADAGDIFGKRYGASFATLAKGIREGTVDLEAFTAKLNESGAAAETASKRMDTLAGDFKKLSSAWEGLQIAATESAEGPMRMFTQSLTEAIDSVTKAEDGFDVLDRVMKNAGVTWDVFTGDFDGDASKLKTGMFGLLRLEEDVAEKAQGMIAPLGKVAEKMEDIVDLSAQAGFGRYVGTHEGSGPLTGGKGFTVKGKGSSGKAGKKGRRSGRGGGGAAAPQSDSREISRIDQLLMEAEMAAAASDAYAEKAIASADASAASIAAADKEMQTQIEAAIAQQETQNKINLIGMQGVEAMRMQAEQKKQIIDRRVAYELMTEKDAALQKKMINKQLAEDLEQIEKDKAEAFKQSMMDLGVQAGAVLMEGLVAGARGEEDAFKRVMRGLLPIIGQAIGLATGLPGGMAIGGTIGGAAAGLFHDGGVVYPNPRRAHQGAYIGRLGNGEVPAVLQAGEVVVNRENVSRMGGPERANAQLNGGGGVAPMVVNITAMDTQGVRDALRRGGLGEELRTMRRTGRGM